MGKLRYNVRLSHLLVEAADGRSVKIPWLDLARGGGGLCIPETLRQSHDFLPKRVTCLGSRAFSVIRRLCIRAMKAQLATGNYQRDWECNGIFPLYFRVLQTLAGVAMFIWTCQLILQNPWWTCPEVLRHTPTVVLITIGAITIFFLAGILAMTLFPWSRWTRGNVAELTATSDGLDARMLDGAVHRFSWGDLAMTSEIGSLVFRGSSPAMLRPRMRGGPGGEYNDWLLLVAAVKESVHGRKALLEENRRQGKRLARKVVWFWFPGALLTALWHQALGTLPEMGRTIGSWTLLLAILWGISHFAYGTDGFAAVLDRRLTRWWKNRRRVSSRVRQ